jgi:transposase-like protein
VGVRQIDIVTPPEIFNDTIEKYGKTTSFFTPPPPCNTKEIKMTHRKPKELSEFTKRTDPKWLQAVELVAMGQHTLEEIYTTVGVSRDTLYRWKREPDFVQDVKDKMVVIFEDLIPKAIATVEELLDSTNQKVRLEAAKLILDKTFPNLSEVNERSLQAVKVDVHYE